MKKREILEKSIAFHKEAVANAERELAKLHTPDFTWLRCKGDHGICAEVADTDCDSIALETFAKGKGSGDTVYIGFAEFCVICEGLDDFRLRLIERGK